MTWKSSTASKVIGKTYTPCHSFGEFLMLTLSPAKPKSAHVANHHVQEIAEVDRITADLSPEYLKKTTAVMGCL
jgi:hypothetical protein